MELMLPILPAMCLFRDGNIVNRCVGAFEHVFPNFFDSPVAVREWCEKSGILSDEVRDRAVVDATNKPKSADLSSRKIEKIEGLLARADDRIEDVDVGVD